jgi:hypothetical protein
MGCKLLLSQYTVSSVKELGSQGERTPIGWCSGGHEIVFLRFREILNWLTKSFNFSK